MNLMLAKEVIKCISNIISSKSKLEREIFKSIVVML